VGLAHGCQESNLDSAGFGDRPPIRWLTHMKLETARQGLCPGGGAFVGCVSASYVGTIPVPCSLGCEQAAMGRFCSLLRYQDFTAGHLLRSDVRFSGYLWRRLDANTFFVASSCTGKPPLTCTF
jgi:hypothetical protein